MDAQALISERHMLSYAKSKQLYERGCRSLAGGVSSEFRKNSYPHPLFYQRGLGSRIIDVDGNEFLDFTASQGPLILGHSHPEVLEAVQRACAQGQIFSGVHRLELELAETLQRLIPCAELLRYSLTGSEVVHAALRLARAATRRPKFLRFEGHYHGWLDNVAISVSAPNLDSLGSRQNPNKVPWTKGLTPGLLNEMLVLPWNDLDLVEEVVSREHAQLAAIITEPVMCNHGCILPQPGFLQGLRTLCDRYRVLLIFDEVITGFRLGLAGAQGYFNVVPDLALFGKAIANGWPISVLAGKEIWMRFIARGEVIHAGTLNGAPVGVAAALATLNVLERDRIHDKLFKLGQRLISGLNKVGQSANQPLLVQGPGPVFHAGFTRLQTVRDFRDTLAYDKLKYRAFLAHMQARGIRLIGRGLWYVTAAHSEADIDQCLAAAREAI